MYCIERLTVVKSITIYSVKKIIINHKNIPFKLEISWLWNNSIIYYRISLNNVKYDLKIWIIKEKYANVFICSFSKRFIRLK